jgi:hypothetical protein
MEDIGIDSRPIVYHFVFIDGRWLPGGLFPSAARTTQMLSLVFSLWFVVVLFCQGCPPVPFVGVGLRADWPRELPCPHPAILFWIVLLSAAQNRSIVLCGRTNAFLVLLLYGIDFY